MKKLLASFFVFGITLTMFTGCGKSAEDQTASAEKATVAAGGTLNIPVSEISKTARFYPVEVDGTQMEVIAVKDSEGTIRTAFNTCQICYDSGKGYYEQESDQLVCQNCGNSFTMDQVGITSGGCNPWPILEEDRTLTDNEVQISYEFLKASGDIFANWKTV